MPLKHLLTIFTPPPPFLGTLTRFMQQCTWRYDGKKYVFHTLSWMLVLIYCDQHDQQSNHPQMLFPLFLTVHHATHSNALVCQGTVYSYTRSRADWHSILWFAHLLGQSSVRSRNSVCPWPDSFFPMEAAEVNSKMFGWPDKRFWRDTC